MARFAPVAPTWLLKQLQEIEMLGDYHLLLAHDIDEHQKEYAEIFSDTWRFRNPNCYVILDNSLIELGAPAPTDMIKRAADIIKPNVVVLPDYMHDIEKTITASQSAHLKWGRTWYPYMFVCQGNNHAEYITCCEALEPLYGVQAVGIPRNAVGKLGTRLHLAREIHNRWPDLKIHLLGFSDNIMDDVICAMLPFVQGIDSAVPLRAGIKGAMLNSPYDSWGSPRGDYWDNEQELINPALVHNLNRIRTWIKQP